MRDRLGSGGVIDADVRTDDGLREALVRVPADGGWDGPIGRAVVDALEQVAYRWVRRSDIVDSQLAKHLVGVAWEFLATNTETVVGARSPWSLLHAAMRRRGAAEVLGAELCTSARHARKLSETAVRLRLAAPVHTAARVSVETSGIFDAGSDVSADDPVGDQAVRLGDPDGVSGWDDALRMIYRVLVRAGAPPKQTAEAITAVVDVIGSAESRSRMHTAVYQSPQLGCLSHDQRRALAELLIGTRRGSPESSVWLTLHRALDGGEQPDVHTHPGFASRVDAFAAPYRRAPQRRPPAAVNMAERRDHDRLREHLSPLRDDRFGTRSTTHPNGVEPRMTRGGSRCEWCARRGGPLPMTRLRVG